MCYRVERQHYISLFQSNTTILYLYLTYWPQVAVTLWVCVCVGALVICVLVFNLLATSCGHTVGVCMCGCFGNMCTCIYCVFVLFPLCIFIIFMLLFNFVSYVFLLLCIFCSVNSVFIVPTGTLRLP